MFENVKIGDVVEYKDPAKNKVVWLKADSSFYKCRTCYFDLADDGCSDVTCDNNAVSWYYTVADKPEKTIEDTVEEISKPIMVTDASGIDTTETVCVVVRNGKISIDGNEIIVGETYLMYNGMIDTIHYYEIVDDVVIYGGEIREYKVTDFIAKVY